MWSTITFLLLVGLVSGEFAWKANKEYNYDVYARTLTALPDLRNQYVGIVTKGKLTVQVKSNDVMVGKLTKAEYSEFHDELLDGWNTQIPEKKLNFEKSSLENKPFILHMKNGVVRSVDVDQSMTNDEVNRLKGIISQLQIDVSGENLINSKHNHLPENDNPHAFYKTMEETVTGECEAIYEMSNVPTFLRPHIQPSWAPAFDLVNTDKLFQIMKTYNFSNCDHSKGYNFGITGESNVRPNTNQVGDFLSKSSVATILANGSPKDFTVQYTSTNNRVAVSPGLYEDQKAVVVSQIRLVLEKAGQISQKINEPSKPVNAGSLVYRYNLPSDKQNQIRDGDNDDNSHGGSSSSSESSDSSASDEEKDNQNQNQNGNEMNNNNNRNNKNRNIKKKSNNNRNNNNKDDNDDDDDDDNNDNDNTNRNSDNQKKSRRSRRSVVVPDVNNAKRSGFDRIRELKRSEGTSSSSSSSSSSDSSSSSSSESDEHSQQEDAKHLQPRATLKQRPEIPFMPYFVGNKGKLVTYGQEINPEQDAEKLAHEIGEDVLNQEEITDRNTLEKHQILSELIRTMNEQQIQNVALKLYSAQTNNGGNKAGVQGNPKVNAWKAYRDAVAHAGTGPAAAAIEKWFNAHKFKRNEGVVLITELAKSIRIPTDELLKHFFNIVKSDEVKKQKDLYSAALIAFTNLLERSRVNKRSMRNYYPSEAFKITEDNENKFVIQEVIPYLAGLLEESIRQNNDAETLLNIRALGNVGQAQVLKVFEKYIEGDSKIEEFQRLAIVVAFDRLIINYPSLTRDILFLIYSNMAENPEVRIVAVFQLMRTNPPAAMLQRMAEFTNVDPSEQVQSAVKTAIESAARLTDPNHSDLARNAESARKFLNPTTYGMQYSRTKLEDHVTENLNLAHKYQFSYFGANKNTLPKAIFFKSDANLGGYKMNEVHFQAMVSSVEELLDFLYDHIGSSSNNNKNNNNQGNQETQGGPGNQEKRRNQKKQGNQGKDLFGKWSIKEVAQKLNIQPEEAEELQGQLLLNIMGSEYFQAFDEKILELAPGKIAALATELRTSGLNYNQFFNRKTVEIAFPLATGYPFVFKLNMPSMIQAQGEVKIEMSRNRAERPTQDASAQIIGAINISASAHFVYSSLERAQIGFVTPFNKQEYVAGVNRKVHSHLPLNIHIDLDLVDTEVSVEISPIDPKKDFTALHISSWPYTARQSVMSLRPIEESKDVKVIKARSPKGFQEYFGEQTTGTVFRVEADHQLKHGDLMTMYKMWTSQQMYAFTTFASPLKYHEETNFELMYDAGKSTTHKVKIAFSHDEEFNVNGDSGSSSAPSGTRHPRASSSRGDDKQLAHPSSTSHNGDSRREEFLRNAAAGIKQADAEVYDLSITFEGENKAQMIATVAHGSSPVDDTDRVLVFLQITSVKKSASKQLCMAITSELPNTPALNFQEAMKHDGKSSLNVHLGVGQDCLKGSSEVSVTAELEQTQQYKETVRQSDAAKQCQKNMAQGNNQHPSCLNATFHANLLDHVKISVDFNMADEDFKNATAKVFSFARHALYWNLDENVNKNGKKNRIDAEIYLEPERDSLNVTIQTEGARYEFENIRVHRMLKPAILIHPGLDFDDLISRYYYDNSHICVIDRTQILTFDDSTTQHKIGKCWYVMVQYVESESSEHNSRSKNNNNDNDDDEPDDVSVLVRASSDGQQKEVMIIVAQNNGPDHVVLLSPTGTSSVPRVNVNGQEHQISEEKAIDVHDDDADEKEDQPAIRIYALPGNEAKVEIRGNQMTVYFDGERVRVDADSTYRDSVRGLCGNYNGEEIDDFATPQNCVLRNEKHFTASWALEDETCASDVKQARQAASKAPCSPIEYRGGNAVNGKLLSRAMYTRSDDDNASSSSSSSSSSSDSSDQSNSSDSSDSSNSSEEKDRRHNNGHEHGHGHEHEHEHDHKHGNGNKNNNRGNRNGQKECNLKYQTQYIQSNGKLCFSVEPLAACPRHCSSRNLSQRPVQVHCREQDDSVAQLWKQQIQKGASPDMSDRPTTKAVSFKVPTNCA